MRRKREILPPRLRDWKPGKVQLGLFVRTEEGSVMEWTSNEPNDECVRLSALLLAEATGVAAVIRKVDSRPVRICCRTLLTGDHRPDCRDAGKEEG